MYIIQFAFHHFFYLLDVIWQKYYKLKEKADTSCKKYKKQYEKALICKLDIAQAL